MKGKKRIIYVTKSLILVMEINIKRRFSNLEKKLDPQMKVNKTKSQFVLYKSKKNLIFKSGTKLIISDVI